MQQQQQQQGEYPLLPSPAAEVFSSTSSVGSVPFLEPLCQPDDDQLTQGAEPEALIADNRLLWEAFGRLRGESCGDGGETSGARQ